jgi:hypothetical protein
VASRYKAASALDLNPSAKAQGLEGALGVRSGTWSNKPAPLRAAASSGELPDTVDPSWLDPKSRGPIIMPAVGDIDKILRNHSTMEAVNLVTDMWMAGWFYDFGKKYKKGILSGSETVTNMGKAFSQMAKRRAVGEARDEARRSKLRSEHSDELVPAGGFGGAVNFGEALWQSMGSPDGDRLLDWLREEVGSLNSESQVEAVEAWLDALDKRGGSGKGAFTDAAKATGRSRKSIEKAVNKAIEQLKGKAERDRGVQNILEEIGQRIRTAARDIEIHDVDWESGQEPRDDFDDDFGAHLELEFSLSGKTLSQLLGVQMRVLVKTLEGMSGRDAINRLGTRSASKILDLVIRKARGDAAALVNLFAFDEFGHGAKIVSLDISDDDSHWDAKVDPRSEKIRYTVGLAGIGEWIG